MVDGRTARTLAVGLRGFVREFGGSLRGGDDAVADGLRDATPFHHSPSRHRGAIRGRHHPVQVHGLKPVTASSALSSTMVTRPIEPKISSTTNASRSVAVLPRANAVAPSATAHARFGMMR